MILIQRKHSGFKRQIPLALALFLIFTSAASALPSWPNSIAVGAQSTPCVADLNGDGKMEILTVAADGKLHIWHNDSTPYFSGANPFPVTLSFTDGTMGSIAVGDVIGNGSPDVVIGGDNATHTNSKIILFDVAAYSSVSHAFTPTDSSMKSTVSLIDCRKYTPSGRHQQLDILYRDGNGAIRCVSRTGGGFTEDTLFAGHTAAAEKDTMGSMPITPSLCAIDLGSSSTLVVAASTNGIIYARKIVSTPAAPWTVTGWNSADFGDWFLSSPALGNFDADPKLEVIAGNIDGKLHVLEVDAGALTISTDSNWTIPQTGGWIVSSPAVGDLDHVSGMEVVVGCNDRKVYAFHADGSTVAGWPVETEGIVFASPVLAELDHQPGAEVICLDRAGLIHIWHANGAPMAGWPQELGNDQFYASPAVVDLNGDGRMSLITSSFNGTVCFWDLQRKSLAPLGGWLQFRGDAARKGTF